MEYVIVGLLICILVLLVILLFRKKDNSDMTERLGRFEMDIIKEMNQNFIQVNDKLEARLNRIDDRVNERINENFDKTNRTFQNVLERLSRIDEAQKKIETLSTDIVSLQSILTDKKSRGIYGEVNLKHILVNVFGEKNDKIYQLQCPLPNGTIADCVLYAPNPLGMIAIDSKFPLENYQQMVDRNLSQTERAMHEKQFKIDVKKHIDAISSKYIIPGITSDQAIMFLPAEAIFAEINAYHTDLLDYAYKKKVWITSPTTLISTLSVIQMIIKNIERDQYTSIIHEELKKLGVEFSRYKERWDHLAKSIQMVNKDVENVYITTEKITRKFDSISQVEVNKLEDKQDE
jgi:rmuC domain protein